MPLTSSDIVLVTGGAGFLGQHVVNQLMETDVKEIRVFDKKQFDQKQTVLGLAPFIPLTKLETDCIFSTFD